MNRRELFRRSATAALAAVLPKWTVGQMPANADDGGLRTVNPQFREYLRKALANPSPSAELNNTTLAAMRAIMSANPVPPRIAPGVMEQSIPCSDPNRLIRIFVIGAAPGERKPLLLHMHGGGYVGGTPLADLAALQTIATEHNCVVVTVEYRLAPETKYMGSLEDNYAALRWVHFHAKTLGIDTHRIALKGESAGGGHAAALAFAVRDRKEFQLVQQILIYPMLDDRTGSTVHVSPPLGQYAWTEQMNRFGWSSLLGVAAGSARVPANAVPARELDVTGLPPTFIGVGSIDLFATEDVAFAAKLLAAGVPVEMALVPGAYHGFDIAVPEAPLSVAFRAVWNAALGRAFTPVAL